MSFHISIDDEKEKEGPQPSADVNTVSTILNNFADDTTAHGIPRIITRRRITFKLFWFCLVAITLCAFCYHTSNLIQNYYEYHTNTELVSSEYVEFPTVTICNFNKIKRSKMLSSGRFGKLPEYWKNMLKETVLDYSWMWDSSSDPWFDDYFSWSDYSLNKEGSVDDNFEYNGSDSDAVRNRTRERRDAYSEYFSSYTFTEYISGDFLQLFDEMSDDFIIRTDDALNLTKEKLRDFGHQGQDFILHCTFNKRKCDHSNFTTFQNKKYGNCFTFNITEKQKGKPGFVTKVGLDHGLHLTLFIEQPEYVGILTEESGVRLAIHQGDILPHPEEVGLSVAPGFSTSIGIRQVELKRLDHPYGGCTDGVNKQYLSSDRYKYSIISCQKRCLHDNMADKCGCVNNIYDDYDDVPQCQRHNSTQWKCCLVAETNFTTNKLTCDCPAPCHEYIYYSRSSSALWQSEDYRQHLRAKLLKESKPMANILTDTETARKNLVRVKIYFEELNYELEEQVPTHNIETAVWTLGGLLGLFLGFSVITVFEIAILFYDVMNLVVRRAFGMNAETRMRRPTPV